MRHADDGTAKPKKQSLGKSFNTWFGAAFNTVLWPILGFLFMPYTTLAYMAAMLKNHHTVDGGWLVLVIVAVFIDLGGQGGSARRRRRA